MDNWKVEMRKIGMLIFSLGVIAARCLSQGYNQYPLVRMYQWNIGTGKDNLATYYPGSDIGPNGPTGLCFNARGNLIIYDNQNQKIKKYSYEYNVIKSWDIEKVDTNIQIQAIKNQLLFTGKLLVFRIIEDKNPQVLIKYGVEGMGKNLHTQYYLFNDLLFIQNGTSIESMIPNPVLNPAENNHRFLNEVATRELFKEPEKYGLAGVTLDSKNRLFVNGELETRDYRTFYEYWSKKNNSETLKKKNVVFSWDATQYLKQSVAFVGKDSIGNRYWTPGFPVMVFNPQGYLIDFIIPDPDHIMEKKKTSYAIHPSGDIYFLDYDKVGVYLYRVENVWDRLGRAFWYETNATITSPNVRLRKKPSLTGEEAGYLQTDDRVVILETSVERTKVGEMTKPWYRVKTKTGLEAWAYGGIIEKDDE
jgi:hypothetical protein